jgi:hypothetical protein
MNDDRSTEHLRMLVPLFLIGGLSLFAAPLFHPNNTCKDWLEKWGQLSAERMWIPIHQVASFGFAVGAGAALLLCLVGPRRLSGLVGGAFFAAGYGMMSMLTLIHATAVSVMGNAFNAATTPADKQLMRTIANAFVTYDVSVEGVAAVLISGGAIALSWYLWRIGVASAIPALVLAGDGAIWGVQYYRLLRIVHYGFPEWVPYTSIGLWLCAAGILLLVRKR